MRSLKTLAIAAVAAATLTVGATVALAAIETGAYTGTTSQVENGIHGKVKLKVASAHKLKLFKYQFHAVCQNHSTGYTNTFEAHNGPINNKGHFEDVALFKFSGPDSTTAQAKIAFVGDINGDGTAQGAFGVKITFTNPDGSINDKCHTGIIDWHAHRT